MKEFKDFKNINFLGFEILRTNNKIFIKQTSLIEKVLMKFEMGNCKTRIISMETKLNLSNTETESINENIPYRELIGSLMYIMMGTRTDISYCINYFSQFPNSFNLNHWNII